MSQKGKGRKFFQQLQPTFSIDVPQATTTKLEFLDHSDPAKDIVVRKKAREWVNKNKAISKQSGDSRSLVKPKKVVRKVEDTKREQKQGKAKQYEPMKLNIALPAFNINTFDPFNVLPDVGRKYDHIIQFFLTSCPEEIPCSDDKYSQKAKGTMVSFSADNTVLGNMAKSELTFILWLYATVSIRDGMGGSIDTEEVQWFYTHALRAVRETLKEESVSGEYSNHLVSALGCITATASFSGMFKTAELHRDALIKLLSIRGDGDILKGLRSITPWSAKAVQWCEVMVATQLIEMPKIPYCISPESRPPPQAVIDETARLTSNSLANLPRLSEPLQNVVQLLHHLAIVYALPTYETKIDGFLIQPLYDAEYALLQILHAQKLPTHEFSDIEVLLAEVFQLYFWTGPRMLPPQTRLCDLLISRIMKGLLPLLLESVPEVDLEYSPEAAASLLDQMSNWVSRPSHHPKSTNNIITWSLALGTMVSASLRRPEHSWFKGHLLLQMQHLGVDKNEGEYLQHLKVFPATDGFAWINLRTLYDQLKA